MTRDPVRAKYVKTLVIQYDSPLGSAIGFSARRVIKDICQALVVVTELETLQVSHNEQHSPDARSLWNLGDGLDGGMLNHDIFLSRCTLSFTSLS